MPIDEILDEMHADVIVDAADHCIVRKHRGDFGRIAVEDKRRKRMIYLVEYETDDRLFGFGATQIKIWRDPNSAIVQGMTDKIFDDVLLPTFGTIVSAAQEIEIFARFWRGRLAVAAARGDDVGLADCEIEMVEWYDPDEGFYEDWIDVNNIWTRNKNHQSVRFIISRKQLDKGGVSIPDTKRYRS